LVKSNEAEQARRKEEAAWLGAKSAGTIGAYQAYMASFPNGRHLQEAQDLINNIKQVEALEKLEKTKREQQMVAQRQEEQKREAEEKLWQQTKKVNSLAAYRKYLQIYPDGIYADEAYDLIIVKEVDAIQAAPHGILPAPQANTSSSLYSTNTEIAITNATNYKLTVWYDGYSKKKLVLDPGESYEIELTPGPYRVAASVNAASVRPFAGNHTLKAGSYTERFYIKTSRY
jgi:hypothetical protein